MVSKKEMGTLSPVQSAIVDTQTDDVSNVTLNALASALSLHPSAFNITSSKTDRLLFANNAYKQLWNLTDEPFGEWDHSKRSELILDKLAGNRDENRAKLLYVVDNDVEYRCDNFQMALGKSLLRVTLRLPPPNESCYLIEWRELSATEEQSRLIRYERDLLLSLTEHIPDQIYFKDKDSRFVRINRSLATRFGIPDPANAVGKSDADFYAPEFARMTREEDLEVMQTQAPQIKKLHHEVGGASGDRWSIASKYPWIDKDGQVVGVYGISLDVTELKQKEREIWRQANIDVLTHLPNRNLLKQRWCIASENAEVRGCSVGLIHFDIDHFSEINTALGQTIGDLLLQQVGQRLDGLIQQRKATVARLEGDDFAVLIDEIQEDRDLLKHAARIQLAFESPFYVESETISIRISLGLVSTPRDALDFESAIICAEQATLRSKRPDAMKINVYNAILSNESIERFTLGKKLQEALTAKQLSVEFQPVVNLASGRTEKVEALVRWNDPERGFIPPSKFIPIAETLGSIVELGDFVFRTAIETVAQIRKQTGVQLTVSINMSPVQLYSDRFVLQLWRNVLEKTGFPAQDVSIELTEGVFLDPNPRVMERINKLKELGLSLSLDDFGTGYSSLSFLDNLEFDYLKLDRSFVQELSDSPKKRALATAVLDMARALEIKVIAEGIESENQIEWLEEMGCEFVQGFYYSRSLTPEKLIEWLIGNH